MDATEKQIYRNDRTLHGGGVLIACAPSIKHEKIKLCDLLYPVEAVGIHIPKNDNNSQDVVLLCVYIPPSLVRESIKPLSNVFDFVFEKYPSSGILVVGDFNFPDIDWSLHTVRDHSKLKTVHKSFLDLLMLHNLIQMVRRPTHCQGNILDLVLTNRKHQVNEIEIIEPGLSDHFMVYMQFKMNIGMVTTDPKVVRLYGKADIQGIHNCLNNTIKSVKNAISEQKNINTVWNIFEQDLKMAVDKHVPKIAIKPRNTREPLWFNKTARKLIKQQRRVYNKYKKSRLKCHLVDYKMLRRKNRKMFRQIEREYYDRVLYNPLTEGQSKPFYSFFKRKNGKDNRLLPSVDDNVTILDRANEFNSFFQSVFSNTNGSFPEYDHDSESSIRVSTDGVRKMIRDLKKGKAPGPDGIRKEDLVLDIELTSAILSHIFQYSLDTGVLPSSWKLANVVPIFKKGDRSVLSNYRPVSLTSIVCKLLEHIVLCNINQCLNGILVNYQHGFRHGLSCTTQLVTTIHDIMTLVEKNDTVHTAVLDFAKAFDKVSHQLLMKKLLKTGISLDIVKWIQNFLTDRFQRVVMEGVESRLLSVTSGVPQGSVLGPTLFLVYINDIGEMLKFCKIRLFADDALLYASVNNQLNADCFQKDLDILERWCEDWKMVFNVGKCQIVKFGDQGQNTYGQYTLSGRPIATARQFTYLGVQITDHFSWEEHIDQIAGKACQRLGMLKSVLYGAPRAVKRVAYVTLCRPLLEYACEVWDPYLSKHVDKLEMIQRRAVRFIAGLKGRDGVSAAREALGLELLQNRRKTSRTKLLLQIIDNSVHSSLAQSFNNITAQQNALHTHKTRSVTAATPLAVPAQTQFYYHSFLPRTSRDIRESLF